MVQEHIDQELFIALTPGKALNKGTGEKQRKVRGDHTLHGLLQTHSLV